MIYAISDIHGHYEAFKKRIDQLTSSLEKDENKLVLLGDYIDRGPDSYQVLTFIYDLQMQYGKDKVIVLKGNHEEWFLSFLEEEEDVWLAEDREYQTSRTFLSEEQRLKLQEMKSMEESIAYIRSCIKTDHQKLITWMKEMPYYYETPTQIFVHAGVEEEISEEEIDWCALATPKYILTGKFPPTTGKFYKDIIAGHIAAASVAGDDEFEGIYFDKASHYYIDGCVEKTGRLLCFAYDEDEKKSYQLDELGNKKDI